MRSATLFAFGIVLLASPAVRAQNIGGAANLWQGTPRNIVNKPIDTSRALGMANVDKALRMPSAKANSPLSLGGILPNVSMPSWPPKAPQVSALPQAQNQFQPTPPKGGFNMFNFMNKTK